MLSVPGTWLSLSQVSAWSEIGGATFGQDADCWDVSVRGLYDWKFKSSSENFQLSSREFASPSWTSVLFSYFHTGLPGLCMGSSAGGNRTTSVCAVIRWAAYWPETNWKWMVLSGQAKMERYLKSNKSPSGFGGLLLWGKFFLLYMLSNSEFLANLPWRQRPSWAWVVLCFCSSHLEVLTEALDCPAS